MSLESPAIAAPPPPAPRPRVWTVWLAFVLLLVGLLVAAVFFHVASATVEGIRAAKQGQTPEQVQAGVQAALLQQQPVRPLQMSLGSLLNFGVLVVTAGALAALSATPWRERLALLPARRFPPLALFVACAGVLLLGEALGCIALLTGAWDEAGPLEVLRRLSTEATPGEFGLMLLVMAVGAGVGEELFFRGYLQTRLVARWGRVWGIVIASLAFALIHFDALHSSLAFGTGLFLGWVAERAGSIRPAIVLHAVNNAASFSLSRWGPGEELGVVIGPLVLLLVCAAGFAACVGWLLHRSRLPEVEPQPDVLAPL